MIFIQTLAIEKGINLAVKSITLSASLKINLLARYAINTTNGVHHDYCLVSVSIKSRSQINKEIMSNHNGIQQGWSLVPTTFQVDTRQFAVQCMKWMCQICTNYLLF